MGWRKCRAVGMIYPQWFNRPIKDSISLYVECCLLIMFWMETDQACSLSSGRKMRKQRVSMPHPVTTFISSRRPSPYSLRKQSRSSRGMGSDGCTGRPTVCIASGTAFAPLSVF